MSLIVVCVSDFNKHVELPISYYIRSVKLYFLYQMMHCALYKLMMISVAMAYLFQLDPSSWVLTYASDYYKPIVTLHNSLPV